MRALVILCVFAAGLGATLLGCGALTSALAGGSTTAISTDATGCRCGGGHTIVVSCHVHNGNAANMTVRLGASASTGSFDIHADGTSDPITLSPGQDSVEEVVTHFNGLTDCSSCKDSACGVQ